MPNSGGFAPEPPQGTLSPEPPFAQLKLLAKPFSKRFIE